jgi:tetratricopeptide (TPR) repeat protein
VTAFVHRKNIIALLVLSSSILAACSTPEEIAQKHIQAGKAYMEKGKLADALLEFKSSNQDGLHAEAYYYMALLDEKVENYAAMRENLHSCLQQDDGLVKAKLKLAQVELIFGNLAEANKQIDGVLIGYSDNVSAQLLKATIYIREGKFPDALNILDTVLNAHPDNIEALTEKAEYYFRQNQIDQALQTSNLALQKSADYRPLLQLRINIHSRLKDIDSVITDLNELIRVDPTKDGYRIRLAAIYNSRNNLPEAESILRSMVAQNPYNIEGKLLLLQFLDVHDRDRVVTEYQSWVNTEFSFKNRLKDVLLNHSQMQAQNDLETLELSKWMLGHDFVEPVLTPLNQIADKSGDTKIKQTAQLYLAEILYNKRQLAEAEAAADKILKESSDFIEASFLKARIYLSQKKPDETIKLMEDQVWAKDQTGDLYSYIGMAYLQKHDQQQADKNFKLALDSNPVNRLAFFSVYNNYLRTNQKENAKQILDKALKLKPHLDWLLITKAEMEIQDKNWNEAKNTVQLLAMFSNNAVTSAYLRANIIQGLGQYPEAIAIYQKILEQSPNYTDALLNLAMCYETINARDKSQAFLEAHHEKYPTNIAAVGLLGDIYAANKDLVKFKKLYTDQVKVTPKVVILYVYLAKIAALENKNPDEIKQILLTGLENNPDDPKLSIALAGWYDEVGDTESSRKIYEHFWQIHPESELLSNNLANILLNSTSEVDIVRGEALAQKLKDSSNANYLDTYAWSLIREGQTPKAIQLLTSLSEKTPNSIDVRYHLGVAYKNSGNKTQALAELKQALALADKHKRNFIDRNNALKLIQELETEGKK